VGCLTGGKVICGTPDFADFPGGSVGEGGCTDGGKIGCLFGSLPVGGKWLAVGGVRVGGKVGGV
jgi:hypothetical protein